MGKMRWDKQRAIDRDRKAAQSATRPRSNSPRQDAFLAKMRAKGEVFTLTVPRSPAGDLKPINDYRFRAVNDCWVATVAGNAKVTSCLAALKAGGWHGTAQRQKPLKARTRGTQDRTAPGTKSTQTG